jgi:hypothetical protein
LAQDVPLTEGLGGWAPGGKTANRRITEATLIIELERGSLHAFRTKVHRAHIAPEGGVFMHNHDARSRLAYIKALQQRELPDLKGIGSWGQGLAKLANPALAERKLQ